LVGPPNYSVLDLKTLQDWVLQRRFKVVPGVIDVTSWGGRTKTYELQVDFNKLVANGLTLPHALAGRQQFEHQRRRHTPSISARSLRSCVRRSDPLYRQSRQYHDFVKRRNRGARQGRCERCRR